MKTVEDIKELFRDTVEGLVAEHDYLIVEMPEIASGGWRLYFRVSRRDHGKVIGKAGRNIKSLTKMFEAIGAEYGHDIRVVLDHPTEGEEATDPFTNDPDWSPDDLIDLVDRFSEAFGEPPLINHDRISDSYETMQIEFPEAVTVEVADAAKTIFEAVARAEGKALDIDLAVA